MSEPRRETCQGGCPSIEVGPGGRVVPHSIVLVHRNGDIVPLPPGVMCARGGHPSREELARRKAKRAAKAAALVAELQPEAAATLDALLEGRTDEDARRLLARLDDMRRAAASIANGKLQRANTRLHARCLRLIEERRAGAKRKPSKRAKAKRATRRA